METNKYALFRNWEKSEPVLLRVVKWVKVGEIYICYSTYSSRNICLYDGKSDSYLLFEVNIWCYLLFG